MSQTPQAHPFDPEKIATACAVSFAAEKASETARIAAGLAVQAPDDFGRSAVYRIVLTELRKAVPGS